MVGEVREAFLLCGGASTRLGYPKEMLRVDGMTLAAALVRRLRGVFERVAVVSNRPAYLEHCLDVPVRTDVFPGLGPLAGVHAGLTHCSGEGAFFLGCDMPLVSEDLMRRLVAAAARSPAAAVVPRTARGPEPLCGVYRKSLLSALTDRLQAGEGLSATAFLESHGAEFLPVTSEEAAALRDVDTEADLALLKEAFEDVEPLPVRRAEVRRIGGAPLESDTVVEELPFAFYVNGVHLVTVLCMPGALRELAVGFLAYMGLIERYADVRSLELDYAQGRVAAALDVGEDRLRRAVRLQVSSTCGAGVYGPALRDMRPAADPDAFRVEADHILDVERSLRNMAPVFACTGATHQAAFSDGRRVVHFFEDVGRHNAIDKVIGRCLMDGTDARHGVLFATGRLNAEMVMKALRQGIPVAASRSAVTQHAIRLAQAHGLTVVGFARGGRLNVYTWPQRVLPGRGGLREET